LPRKRKTPAPAPQASSPATDDGPLEPEVEVEPEVGAEPGVASGEEALAAEPVQDVEVVEEDAEAPALHDGGDGGRSLARADPLRAYMAEVSRYPVLSREEEHALAVKYARTGDRDAAWRLTTSNLRLVVKIAREYHRTMFQLLDLIQEGNVGLMQAVKKFDPLRGVKLSTYAAWWIRAYIIRFIMENWRQVKLGTTQAQRRLFFNLSKERERLLARGIDPTPRLLARNLRVDEKDVAEMTARMAGDDLSLDQPVRGEDGDAGVTRLDRLEDASTGAEEAVGADELRRVFREKLEGFASTLTDEREKAIFTDRLLPPEGREPASLTDLGARFGLTRERARQIEAKLTARLREYMKQQIPDFELLGPE
jgi:RNA polymerase sigma-32 factor